MARGSLRCLRNQVAVIGEPSGVRKRYSEEKLNLRLRRANLNMAIKGKKGPLLRAKTMVHAPLDLECLGCRNLGET